MPDGQTSAASASDGLVGFGADDIAWEAHHIAHPQYRNRYVYNPDPALPKINGNMGAVYVEVQHKHGRVLGYNMNLHRSTLDEAMAIAQREFPPDVRVLSTLKRDGCEEVKYASATLGSSLSRASVGDGSGEVVVGFLDTRTDGSRVRSPETFNLETFDLMTPDLPSGC
jgi:hypothetical protein